jgi:hypothetical protein
MHGCWAGNYMVFIRSLPEASSLFCYSTEIVERAWQNFIFASDCPKVGLFKATKYASHSSAEFASRFAANITPNGTFKSFANAQTYFIAYYKADHASYSNGL